MQSDKRAERPFIKNCLIQIERNFSIYSMTVYMDLILVKGGKEMFDAGKVKGYAKLNDMDKKLFDRFCKRFYEAWEYPEDHAPIKIERMDKKYLKVTLNDGDWLHILRNGEWY